MKTLKLFLRGLVILWVSNLLSGCLVHYHYPEKAIQVQLRSKDDPAKVWVAIDGVLKALDYQLKVASTPTDLDTARTYVRPRFGDQAEIEVGLDRSLRVFQIRKFSPWLGLTSSSTSIDSRLTGLRTLLVQAVPGTPVVIVNVSQE